MSCLSYFQFYAKVNNKEKNLLVGRLLLLAICFKYSVSLSTGTFILLSGLPGVDSVGRV